MTNPGGTWFLTILFKQKHCWLRLNRTQKVLYGGKKTSWAPNVNMQKASKGWRKNNLEICSPFHGWQMRAWTQSAELQLVNRVKRGALLFLGLENEQNLLSLILKLLGKKLKPRFNFTLSLPLWRGMHFTIIPINHHSLEASKRLKVSWLPEVCWLERHCALKEIIPRALLPLDLNDEIWDFGADRLWMMLILFSSCYNWMRQLGPVDGMDAFLMWDQHFRACCIDSPTIVSPEGPSSHPYNLHICYWSRENQSCGWNYRQWSENPRIREVVYHTGWSTVIISILKSRKRRRKKKKRQKDVMWEGYTSHCCLWRWRKDEGDYSPRHEGVPQRISKASLGKENNVIITPWFQTNDTYVGYLMCGIAT